MHTHSVRTRFTFGDYVRFDSQLQRVSGEGRIIAITFGSQGQIDYIIQPEDERGIHLENAFAGILEHEMGNAQKKDDS